MRSYAFDTPARALAHLGPIIWAEGERRSPRGVATRELRDVMVQIADPTDPCMFKMGRNWNPRLAVAEFLQLVGGFSDPDAMSRITPQFDNFKNGGLLLGAYGPRVQQQMQHAVDLLTTDPDTRQAVVQIWDPSRDQNRAVKDIPCTIGFVFSIQEDALCMTTHMRSNDLWWGWSYDAFQFTQLQATVAQYLDRPVGHYTHFVNSLHVYERDIENILKLTLREPDDNPKLTGIDARRVDTWADVQRYAQLTFYGTPDYEPEGASEQFYLNQMRRVWQK